jgi:hypothetical protein
MNREQRRHPQKEAEPPRPPYEKEPIDNSPPEDEQSVRAKSWRHKKVTADKWNQ